jgi:oligopeptide/dipeptide ABC transporter ATP-binding protein
MPLLEIKDLTVEFTTAGSRLRAVDGLNLTIDAGETVALVGGSGCGKSATALSIARLLPSPPAQWTGGEILLNGVNVLTMTPPQLRAIRGGMVGYVFQDPTASLNPVMRTGSQVMEALREHRPDRANNNEVVRLLELVGIPAAQARARDYPFELSGGMQQRVMLAMALAPEPKLLVADEPTTALDVTTQAQILDLLQELKQRVGMALLLITHNLALVGNLAQRLFVMYAGRIVESGPAREVLSRPRHPYTRALVQSVPRLGQTPARLSAIEGHVPSPGANLPGCSFAPRCPIARPECSQAVPALLESDGWFVRCPFWQTAAAGAATEPPPRD